MLEVHVARAVGVQLPPSTLFFIEPSKLGSILVVKYQQVWEKFPEYIEKNLDKIVVNKVQVWDECTIAKV